MKTIIYKTEENSYEEDKEMTYEEHISNKPASHLLLIWTLKTYLILEENTNDSLGLNFFSF